MRKLKVVPAAEVGGRPRWWLLDGDDNPVTADDLHTEQDNAPSPDKEAQYAIVADKSPEQPAPPAVDPRESEVWTAAFCTHILVGRDREEAARRADTDLDEWRKRFGRKETP